MKLLQLALRVAERGQRLARVAAFGQIVRLLDQAVNADVFVVRLLLGAGRANRPAHSTAATQKISCRQNARGEIALATAPRVTQLSPAEGLTGRNRFATVPPVAP